MPKYKNKGLKDIYLEYDDKILPPGKETITKSFYDDPNLELINIEPCLKPIKESKIYKLDPGDKVEINVAQSRYISFFGVGDINIYVNIDPDNGTTVPIKIRGKGKFTIKNFHREVGFLYVKNVDQRKKALFYVLGLEKNIFD